MCVCVQIPRFYVSHTFLIPLQPRAFRVCCTAFVLHGWMGLLVGSLIISEGERGRDSVRERVRGGEKGKGNERRAEMTALVNLPLLLASSPDDKGGSGEVGVRNKALGGGRGRR